MTRSGGADENEASATRTAPSWSEPHARSVSVSRFELQSLGTTSAGTQSWRSSSDRSSIGSHPSNDFVLEDRMVSRFHCEIVLSGESFVLRDLGSRNGTLVDGVNVVECRLRDGATIRIGASAVRFSAAGERQWLPVSESDRFGNLAGRSPAMAMLFGALESVAAANCSVLLEGETGSGKGAAAEAIHEASGRPGPFVVVDCGAIPANLLESELYGHERGAFTGAIGTRVGAFEEADRGTLFLDEIGELPLELQPKLLRVLETRRVRRVGSNATHPIDVRFVAATNRDLRMDVNAGRFRADLYYRLAVVRLRVPPLRERIEDLPLLARELLASLGAEPHTIEQLLGPDLLARLEGFAWPGNVRELRNYLERCLVFQRPVPLEGAIAGPRGAPRAPNLDLPYSEARRQALDDFEREYAERLLQRHGGRTTVAARAAGLNRVYFYRILRRHGLRGR